MNKSYQALGRLKTREMNKTETKYAEWLDTQKHLGNLLWWQFEPIKLREADGCYYSPDFMVLTSKYLIELHEVKGKTRKTNTKGVKYDAPWAQDDSKVKIKVAAEQFPFVFRMCYPATGGGWHADEV